jgi:hypothetical protein
VVAVVIFLWSMGELTNVSHQIGKVIRQRYHYCKTGIVLKPQDPILAHPFTFTPVPTPVSNQVLLDPAAMGVSTAQIIHPTTPVIAQVLPDALNWGRAEYVDSSHTHKPSKQGTFPTPVMPKGTVHPPVAMPFWLLMAELVFYGECIAAAVIIGGLWFAMQVLRFPAGAAAAPCQPKPEELGPTEIVRFLRQRPFKRNGRRSNVGRNVTHRGYDTSAYEELTKVDLSFIGNFLGAAPISPAVCKGAVIAMVVDKYETLLKSFTVPHLMEVLAAKNVIASKSAGKDGLVKLAVEAAF